MEQTLGDSYAAYEGSAPGCAARLEYGTGMAVVYTPQSVVRKRAAFLDNAEGHKKEKNLYWLHVFEGYFSVAVWFKEKERAEVLSADVSEQTKHLIHDAKNLSI